MYSYEIWAQVSLHEICFKRIYSQVIVTGTGYLSDSILFDNCNIKCFSEDGGGERRVEGFGGWELLVGPDNNLTLIGWTENTYRRKIPQLHDFQCVGVDRYG
jgi:hypothetical protein